MGRYAFFSAFYTKAFTKERRERLVACRINVTALTSSLLFLVIVEARGFTDNDDRSIVFVTKGHALPDARCLSLGNPLQHSRHHRPALLFSFLYIPSAPFQGNRLNFKRDLSLRRLSARAGDTSFTHVLIKPSTRRMLIERNDEKICPGDLPARNSNHHPITKQRLILR